MQVRSAFRSKDMRRSNRLRAIAHKIGKNLRAESATDKAMMAGVGQTRDTLRGVGDPKYKIADNGFADRELNFHWKSFLFLKGLSTPSLISMEPSGHERYDIQNCQVRDL